MLTLDQQLRRLATGERHERLAALRALKRFGAEASPAVDALIQALGDEETSVRAHAAEALRSIGPGAVGAVTALTRALSDERVAVRKSASQALGEIGPAAVEAADELMQAALADVDSGVRREAARALPRIGLGKISVRQILEQIVEDQETRARVKATSDYREWGIFKGFLVNSEVRGTREQVAAKVHPRAVNVLVGCGTMALATIVEAIDSPLPEVRLVMGDALTRIAKIAPDPALRRALPVLKQSIARERTAPVAAKLEEAMRTIEEVLGHLKDLPIPATSNETGRLDLPIPMVTSQTAEGECLEEPRIGNAESILGELS